MWNQKVQGELVPLPCVSKSGTSYWGPHFFSFSSSLQIGIKWPLLFVSVGSFSLTPTAENQVFSEAVVSNLFDIEDWFRGRQFFHRLGRGRWFGDDSSMLHLLCPLFVLSLQQLNLRSSGIRSWRLRTPPCSTACKHLFIKFSYATVSLAAAVHSLKSCPTLCNPTDSSTPGSSVLHYLPEFVQTHVHWVSDAIQPSHPLSSTSPPAFNLSQHQGLFYQLSSLHQVAKVLELQHESFHSISMVDFLYDGLVWSPCCPRDSQESSPKPQSQSINS